MKVSKRLNLEELKVASFVTAENKENVKAKNGGEGMATSDPEFCLPSGCSCAHTGFGCC